MDFSQVFDPISNQLERFETRYKEILQSDSVIIRRITEHLMGASGKRLRPALLYLTSGKDNDSALYAALAVELIHTATLLHDDVIDESSTRRGIDTVNYKWNNLISVLMGDYFFAKAFGLLVKAEKPDLMTSFAATTERVSVGELNQAFYTGNFDIDEDIYLQIIADKTASLFACSAEAGAICSGQDPKTCDMLKSFGENLGLAFQITDDLLDLIGESTKTGKSLGSDIREGWVTLPLIYALRNGNAEHKKRFQGILGADIAQSDLDEVVGFVRKNGGIEYAEQKAKGYVEKAIAIVRGLDGLPTRGALENLATLAAARDK
ncbi:MAG TPA: polyprenyl synthetase [candidate division Zixibacteria bacterium]|jgi:octaprenyl-diphosphate synthase|nr:polyprenyl synthetase [candidate division Zixibacteria bacterium]HBZ00947.1 polyprenyl synthetase [candidate division Zixibacteria bacterium]